MWIEFVIQPWSNLQTDKKCTTHTHTQNGLALCLYFYYTNSRSQLQQSRQCWHWLNFTLYFWRFYHRDNFTWNTHNSLHVYYGAHFSQLNRFSFGVYERKHFISKFIKRKWKIVVFFFFSQCPSFSEKIVRLVPYLWMALFSFMIRTCCLP